MTTTQFFYRDPDAPTPQRPRRVGVAALIEHDGRLLLERRSDAPVWGLVAGAVEDGETFADAIRREVREETGLEVSDIELFGTFSDPSRIVSYPDGNIFRVATLAYTVRVDDVSVLRMSEESTDLRFFAREELPPAELVATHAAILERFLAGATPPVLD